MHTFFLRKEKNSGHEGFHPHVPNTGATKSNIVVPFVRIVVVAVGAAEVVRIIIVPGPAAQDIEPYPLL